MTRPSRPIVDITYGPHYFSLVTSLCLSHFPVLQAEHASPCDDDQLLQHIDELLLTLGPEDEDDDDDDDYEDLNDSEIEEEILGQADDKE